MWMMETINVLYEMAGYSLVSCMGIDLFGLNNWFIWLGS